MAPFEDQSGTCIACCLEYAIRDLGVLTGQLPKELDQEYHDLFLSGFGWLLEAQKTIVGAVDRPGWLPPSVCCGPQAQYLQEKDS